MDETLTRRFGPFFRHPDPDHDVLVAGDRAVACKNVRQTLTWIGTERHVSGEPTLYDERLLDAVRRFQQDRGHRSMDGHVGPGTRALLVDELLRAGGVGRFAELDGSDSKRIPTVFISYAWLDSDRVDKLDQWLQDHGVSVLRDSSSFVGGQDIKEAIRISALNSDKVLAIWSQNSSQREWPNFEHYLTEEVERLLNTRMLVYVRLDDTPLKMTDPNRIAIDARNRPLKLVGDDILKTLGFFRRRPRIKYDSNKPI